MIGIDYLRGNLKIMKNQLTDLIATFIANRQKKDYLITHQSTLNLGDDSYLHTTILRMTDTDGEGLDNQDPTLEFIKDEVRAYIQKNELTFLHDETLWKLHGANQEGNHWINLQTTDNNLVLIEFIQYL